MSTSRGLSLLKRLVGGLILAIGALPAAAQPTNAAFVVLHSPYDQNYPVKVWVAECKGGVNPGLNTQKLDNCTLTRPTCQPCLSADTAKCKADKDVCSFVISSTDGPPATLVFGVSSGTHCYWVWDKYAGTYVRYCPKH